MRAARLPLLVGLLACLLLPGSASAAGLATQRTWHGDQIRLYPALHAGYDGRGVTVAILDGWVDTTHPDFQGRAKYAVDCTSGNGTCTTTRGKDACGQYHGTHVAGTIASSSYGVAPRARLLAIRVLKGTKDCAGNPSDVAAGIRWAVAHGAKVLNLSLGPDVPSSSTGPITAAVQQAADAGVVVVFSAGNADLPIAQSYGNDALVVAATGPNGALADYSQHGTGVSVAAPGGQPDAANRCTQATCVTSLYPGGQYAVAAGTSMAAPHVAGLAALLFQQRPTRSRTDVINRITGTAHPLSGAGAGRVDVAAALGVKVTKPAPRPSATRTSSPRPRIVPRPTHATVRTVVTPSPLRPKPTATRTPTPRPTPSAVVTTPPVTEDAPVLASSTEIPVPLAGIAGALIGLAGTAVLVFGRR